MSEVWLGKAGFSTQADTKIKVSVAFSLMFFEGKVTIFLLAGVWGRLNTRSYLSSLLAGSLHLTFNSVWLYLLFPAEEISLFSRDSRIRLGALENLSLKLGLCKIT